MYHVQALLLTKDDLWSKGTVQQVYLDDTETATLFCLGVPRLALNVCLQFLQR